MALLDPDPYVDLYVTNDWVSVTADVRGEGGVRGIEIEHANLGINDSVPTPCKMALTLDNRAGKYVPWNPVSPYYGTLGLNTPIRMLCGLAYDTFNRVSSNSWGSTSGNPNFPGSPGAGLAFTTTVGVGGTVNATDWSTDGTVAIHSIPTTVAYRQSTLEDIQLSNVEQQVSFLVVPNPVTGGNLEPANLIFRKDANGQKLMRITLSPAGAFVINFRHITSGGAETVLTSDYTSPITFSGQWMNIKAACEGVRYRAKLWQMSDPEPLDWQVNVDSAVAEYFPNQGSVGIRTGVATGNTNTKPVLVKYDNYQVRAPRFSGEVSVWPPKPKAGGKENTTTIEASGILRRLLQASSPVDSTLRRSIPRQPGVVAYWPLEDGTDSKDFASGLPGFPSMRVLKGSPQFATYTTVKASAPFVVAHNADWIGDVPPYTFSNKIQVRWIMTIPAAGGVTNDTILLRFYTNTPTVKFWQVVYKTVGAIQLQAWKSETDSVYLSSVITFNVDNTAQRYSVELQQSGADVAWAMNLYNVFTGDGVTGGSASGTATAVTVAPVDKVWVNPGNAQDQVGYAHLSVQNIISTLYDLYFQSHAFEGDYVVNRLGRLADENQFRVGFEQGGAFSTLMGAQLVNPLGTLIKECPELDMGNLHESKGDRALVYRTRRQLCNRTPVITLSYTGHQLSKDLIPLKDDRDPRNRIKVTRVGGSSAVAEKTTGANSTLPPGKGGVGIYDSQVTVNSQFDNQLFQIAAWRVALGTTDEPRYPEVTIETHRADIVALPSIRQKLLDIRPGDNFSVTNASSLFVYNDVNQQLTGYRESITGFLHEFDLIGTPASSYDVFAVADTTFGRLDSKSTTLRAAINTSATSFTVDTTRVGDLWTTKAGSFPFKIMMGGERMVCTNITQIAPSFIAVGTAAHANNASVAPGIPAGTTTNDTMLLFAAIRNIAATVNVPAGYTVLQQLANVSIMYKPAGASESAPTVTTTGGVAGNTVSAQIATFRNMPATILAVSQQFNNAQNIAFPQVLTTTIADGMAVFFGQKESNWTSVDTLLGGPTEIAEPSSALGSTQGLVWDYQVFTGNSVATPASSFVVNGGSVANSRGIVIIFGNPQTLTVTRSDNGVVKSHAIGEAVTIYRPSHWQM